MKLEFSPSVSSRDTVKRLAFNPITGRDPQLLKIHVAKPLRVRVRRDTVVRVAHQLQLHNRPNCPIEPSTCCRICTPENSNGSPIQHDGSLFISRSAPLPLFSPMLFLCTLQSSYTNHYNQCLPQTPVDEKFFISQYRKTLLSQKDFRTLVGLSKFFVIYTACVPCQQSGRLRRGSRSHLHGPQNQPGDVQPICESDLHFIEGASCQIRKNFHSRGGAAGAW